MSDSERLLRRFADRSFHTSRHKVYVVKGQRFTVHVGSKQNCQELPKIKTRLRRLGLI